MTEPALRTFVGSVPDLHRLERAYDVVEVERLIETFPWWRRVLAWFLWRTPMRRALQRRFLSPYGSVRAILRTRSPISTPAESAVQAQAAEVLARDSSREQPGPGTFGMG